MNFKGLKKLIQNMSSNNFDLATQKLQKVIFALDKKKLIDIILDIGTIPEDITHDSTEEKLFSKATDIVLAKTFRELGLKSTVNKGRANCADVVAKSEKYGYSLVADAKAFRLSRTAKNQKDFKVKSMSDWKGDNDFAVLVCPYYQYPKSNSQIYGQALDNNICLLSWEHLLLFLNNSINENNNVNLSKIWDISNELASTVSVKNKDANDNFHLKGNSIICKYLKIDQNVLNSQLKRCREATIVRGKEEIIFWEEKIKEVNTYSKQRAIKELLKALKLKEKISAINKYISLIENNK